MKLLAVLPVSPFLATLFNIASCHKYTDVVYPHFLPIRLLTLFKFLFQEYLMYLVCPTRLKTSCERGFLVHCNITSSKTVPGTLQAVDKYLFSEWKVPWTPRDEERDLCLSDISSSRSAWFCRTKPWIITACCSLRRSHSKDEHHVYVHSSSVQDKTYVSCTNLTLCNSSCILCISTQVQILFRHW